MFPSISLISTMVEIKLCCNGVLVVKCSSPISFSFKAQTVESSLLKEYSILTINNVCRFSRDYKSKHATPTK